MSAKLLKASNCPVLSHRGHQPLSLQNVTTAISLGDCSSDLQTIGFDLGKTRNRHVPELPSTARLLTGGGDARIVCGPNGANRYGCSALPEPEVIPCGSSTASTISPAGFAAADALRKRLKTALEIEPSHVAYERELGRVRRELTRLCDLEKLPGLKIIFGASGTDLHLFASQLMLDPSNLAR